MLFARECNFMLGAVSMDTLPEAGLPEIAFAGRSNVGKSSLVNALTGRKTLARTSGDPGRTRELNFFDLGGQIRLVDLPGYGFAKAPKDVSARWTRLTRDYLRGRVNLKRIFLLIDARHGLKPSDESVMSDLDNAAVVYQITLTKLDKLKPAEQKTIVEQTMARIARRPAAFPKVAATSSAKKIGLDDLRADIADLAAS
ncbi:putative GTP-binding protein EngB [Marinicauda pacifica]|uniref:Probable GTP-binding protein EngB n=1 Tax=Marinicauda pacifica TaxID=1133559 RepID=A0A4S2HD61_9PROT|nr:ribosome biogenesis GTP-binding protein YihA/YsxC [Marinicauda pacifica]TGY93985.1 YihA family ribosome biogenesis GTP-binding protein [Marinicauda pacifica]GGE31922.1 putative GTP-binding protein EngB [Marinicauda pacifica]